MACDDKNFGFLLRSKETKIGGGWQGAMACWIECLALETEVMGLIPNLGEVAWGLFSFFFLPRHVHTLSQWLGVTLETGDWLRER